MSKLYDVYLEYYTELILLCFGRKEKIDSFLKFWALYRPYSTIKVNYDNNVVYRGKAIDYNPKG